MTIDNRFARKILHHDFTDFVSRTAPNINDLVVAFAGRHQTGGVLVFDLLDFRLGLFNQLGLLLGNRHITDANRNTGKRCKTVAVVLQLVGKHHRRAQTALAEALIDEFGDFLFL